MPLKKKTQNKKPTRRIRKKVEVDEPRQRAGDNTETAFQLKTSEGPDALAEELGEEFVENVTGANDAASEHREQELIDEQGSFVVTSAETEYANDFDAPAPPDAEQAPRPTA